MDVEPRLRAFAAVAREGSFSRAAGALFISQPAVSKHVADVEREVGARLVDRHSRGGTLTSAGEFVANHVLRAQALLAQAARAVAEFREPGTGSLTIVASGVPGTYLLPEVLAAFCRAHPAVRVDLTLGTSTRAVEALRSHRAELGVVGGFVAAPEIEVEALVEDEIVIVGPPAWRGRRPSRRELEAATWILPEAGSATRAAVEAAWADVGIAPSRRLELPWWEALKLAVARGDGVAGCSRFGVADELRNGTLAIVRVPRWNVRRTISIIRLREAALTPSAQAFLVMLRGRWQHPARVGTGVRRNG
jgi:DNA-binding transcriptional LysR family regulator